MSRFFAPKENVKGNLIYIDGQEARHILNVMRLKENDKVVVFDGTGKEYNGFIKATQPKSLTVEIVTTKSPKKEALPDITLAQAIPKKDKMENIIEKATELGVSTIIPIISERTIVQIEKEKEDKKRLRWESIAKTASKQCGRVDIPKIENVQKFSETVYELDKYDLSLMAHLSDKTIDLKNAIRGFVGGRIIIFIGPEGDFTPGEIALLQNTNCKFVSLGKRVLKSDTAGIYVLSILNYELAK